MAKLILASDEKVDALYVEAMTWAKGHPSFASSQRTAAWAAIEFVLNREGETMYAHIAERSELNS